LTSAHPVGVRLSRGTQNSRTPVKIGETDVLERLMLTSTV
jgi:hypothetical protein